MKKYTNPEFTRRNFLKLSAACAVSASIPGIQGCASLPSKSDFNKYNKDFCLIDNCNIVDVKKGIVVKNSSVLCGKNKIIKINPDKNFLPENLTIFDLTNKYLIPGLIDGHLHSTLTGVVGFEVADLAANMRQIDENFINHIKSGVTTIRDMAASPFILHSKLRKIKRGRIIGPRVVYCNKFLNIDGSHPSLKASDLGVIPAVATTFMGDPAVRFKTMKELEEAIAPNLEQGASFIKLTVDNQSLFCGKGEIPVYTDKMLSFIMDFAVKHNIPVAAHQQFKFGYNRILDYPVHSIEHLPSDGLLSSKEAGKLAKNGTAIIPTCCVGNLLTYDEWERFVPDEIKNDRFVKNEISIRKNYLKGDAKKYIEPELHETNDKYAKFYELFNADEILKKHIYVANPTLYYEMIYNGYKNLMKIKDTGALIGCGTDSGIGYDYHGTLWYEMELMNRIGFSPAEVLKCATINNAKILMLENEIGSIDPEKFADFAVLDKNPLEKQNITTYRAPAATFKDGKLLYTDRKVQNKNNKYSFV